MGRATPGFRGGYYVDGGRQYTLAFFGAVLMRSLVFLAYIATDYLVKIKPPITLVLVVRGL